MGEVGVWYSDGGEKSLEKTTQESRGETKIYVTAGLT